MSFQLSPPKMSVERRAPPKNLATCDSSYYQLDINYNPNTEHISLQLLPYGAEHKSGKQQNGTLPPPILKDKKKRVTIKKNICNFPQYVPIYYNQFTSSFSPLSNLTLTSDQPTKERNFCDFDICLWNPSAPGIELSSQENCSSTYDARQHRREHTRHKSKRKRMLSEGDANRPRRKSHDKYSMKSSSCCKVDVGAGGSNAMDKAAKKSKKRSRHASSSKMLQPDKHANSVTTAVSSQEGTKNTSVAVLNPGSRNVFSTDTLLTNDCERKSGSKHAASEKKSQKLKKKRSKSNTAATKKDELPENSQCLPKTIEATKTHKERKYKTPSTTISTAVLSSDSPKEYTLTSLAGTSKEAGNAVFKQTSSSNERKTESEERNSLEARSKHAHPKKSNKESVKKPSVVEKKHSKPDDDRKSSEGRKVKSRSSTKTQPFTLPKTSRTLASSDGMDNSADKTDSRSPTGYISTKTSHTITTEKRDDSDKTCSTCVVKDPLSLLNKRRESEITIKTVWRRSCIKKTEKSSRQHKKEKGHGLQVSDEDLINNVLNTTAKIKSSSLKSKESHKEIYFVFLSPPDDTKITKVPYVEQRAMSDNKENLSVAINTSHSTLTEDRKFQDATTEYSNDVLQVIHKEKTERHRHVKTTKTELQKDLSLSNASRRIMAKKSEMLSYSVIEKRIETNTNDDTGSFNVNIGNGAMNMSVRIHTTNKREITQTVESTTNTDKYALDCKKYEEIPATRSSLGGDTYESSFGIPINYTSLMNLQESEEEEIITISSHSEEEKRSVNENICYNLYNQQSSYVFEKNVHQESKGAILKRLLKNLKDSVRNNFEYDAQTEQRVHETHNEGATAGAVEQRKTKNVTFSLLPDEESESSSSKSTKRRRRSRSRSRTRKSKDKAPEETSRLISLLPDNAEVVDATNCAIIRKEASLSDANADSFIERNNSESEVFVVPTPIESATTKVGTAKSEITSVNTSLSSEEEHLPATAPVVPLPPPPPPPPPTPSLPPLVAVPKPASVPLPRVPLPASVPLPSPLKIPAPAQLLLPVPTSGVGRPPPKNDFVTIEIPSNIPYDASQKDLELVKYYATRKKQRSNHRRRNQVATENIIETSRKATHGISSVVAFVVEGIEPPKRIGFSNTRCQSKTTLELKQRHLRKTVFDVIEVNLPAVGARRRGCLDVVRQESGDDVVVDTKSEKKSAEGNRSTSSSSETFKSMREVSETLGSSGDKYVVEQNGSEMSYQITCYKSSVQDVSTDQQQSITAATSDSSKEKSDETEKKDEKLCSTDESVTDSSCKDSQAQQDNSIQTTLVESSELDGLEKITEESQSHYSTDVDKPSEGSVGYRYAVERKFSLQTHFSKDVVDAQMHIPGASNALDDKCNFNSEVIHSLKQMRSAITTELNKFISKHDLYCKQSVSSQDANTQTASDPKKFVKKDAVVSTEACPKVSIATQKSSFRMKDCLKRKNALVMAKSSTSTAEMTSLFPAPTKSSLKSQKQCSTLSNLFENKKEETSSDDLEHLFKCKPKKTRGRLKSKYTTNNRIVLPTLYYNSPSKTSKIRNILYRNTNSRSMTKDSLLSGTESSFDTITNKEPQPSPTKNCDTQLLLKFLCEDNVYPERLEYLLTANSYPQTRNRNTLKSTSFDFDDKSSVRSNFKGGNLYTKSYKPESGQLSAFERRKIYGESLRANLKKNSKAPSKSADEASVNSPSNKASFTSTDAFGITKNAFECLSQHSRNPISNPRCSRHKWIGADRSLKLRQMKLMRDQLPTKPCAKRKKDASETCSLNSVNESPSKRIRVKPEVNEGLFIQACGGLKNILYDNKNKFVTQDSSVSLINDRGELGRHSKRTEHKPYQFTLNSNPQVQQPVKINVPVNRTRSSFTSTSASVNTSTLLTYPPPPTCKTTSEFLDVVEKELEIENIICQAKKQLDELYEIEQNKAVKEASKSYQTVLFHEMSFNKLWKSSSAGKVLEKPGPLKSVSPPETKSVSESYSTDSLDTKDSRTSVAERKNPPTREENGDNSKGNPKCQWVSMNRDFFVYNSHVKYGRDLNISLSKTGTSVRKPSMISEESGYASSISRCTTSKGFFKKSKHILNFFKTSKVRINVDHSESTGSNTCSSTRTQSLTYWCRLGQTRKKECCNKRTFAGPVKNVLKQNDRDAAVQTSIFFKGPPTPNSADRHPVNRVKEIMPAKMTKDQGSGPSPSCTHTACVKPKEPKQQPPSESKLKRLCKARKKSTVRMENKTTSALGFVDKMSKRTSTSGTKACKCHTDPNDVKLCCLPPRPPSDYHQYAQTLRDRRQQRKDGHYKQLSDFEQIAKGMGKEPELDTFCPKDMAETARFFQKNLSECQEYAKKARLASEVNREFAKDQPEFKEIPLDFLLGRHLKKSLVPQETESTPRYRRCPGTETDSTVKLEHVEKPSPPPPPPPTPTTKPAEEEADVRSETEGKSGGYFSAGSDDEQTEEQELQSQVLEDRMPSELQNALKYAESEGSLKAETSDLQEILRDRPISEDTEDSEHNIFGAVRGEDEEEGAKKPPREDEDDDDVPVARFGNLRTSVANSEGKIPHASEDSVAMQPVIEPKPPVVVEPPAPKLVDSDEPVEIIEPPKVTREPSVELPPRKMPPPVQSGLLAKKVSSTPAPKPVEKVVKEEPKLAPKKVISFTDNSQDNLRKSMQNDRDVTKMLNEYDKEQAAESAPIRFSEEQQFFGGVRSKESLDDLDEKKDIDEDGDPSNKRIVGQEPDAADSDKKKGRFTKVKNMFKRHKDDLNEIVGPRNVYPQRSSLDHSHDPQAAERPEERDEEYEEETRVSTFSKKSTRSSKNASDTDMYKRGTSLGGSDISLPDGDDQQGKVRYHNFAQKDIEDCKDPDKVKATEIGKCFRRGFRPDNLALSGEPCLIISKEEREQKYANLGEQSSYIDFSERESPLEYLLGLGFSVDEASNAIKDEDVKNRLYAAITEARVWVNKINTTQGTLLYLVSYKTKPKTMRYFLQLVEAIINLRIVDAVKLDGFLRLLEKIEDGNLTMITILGMDKLEDEQDEEKIVKKQLRQLFYDVYNIAKNEADEKGIPLSKGAVILLRILAAKYRAGLLPHLELIAKYIGQGLLVNEVQLEAAMIYLSRLDTAQVKLNDFEEYCAIRCGDDKDKNMAPKKHAAKVPSNDS